MFEKEAEEYTGNLLKGVNCNIGNPRARQINSIDVEEAYQKGAEFGYNKANEWHYNEVPKNDNDILCQISKDEVVVGYYHTVAKRYITIDGQDLYNVIAWKEIVFPKESE